MGPDSPPESNAANDATLESQIREAFGRVAYSHKTHEKRADTLNSRLARIKLAQIILSAIATGGFVSIFFGAGNIGTLAGAAVSATLVVLNAYTKDHDLGSLAQQHRQAAADLWLIREKYLSLLVDLSTGDVDAGLVRERRDSLLDRLYAIYSSVPGTNSRAYRSAQKALKSQEELTFSEKEIDAFLPPDLRRD